MRLFLCKCCNRHIKDADETCPFCGGPRGALVGDSSVVARRMSRAAIGLGAAAGTAVALMMSSCSGQASYGMADTGIADAPHDAPNDVGAIDAGVD